MKSRAPLALMEQMVMVVVFVLAAALCLRAFVLADRISEDNTHRDNGVLLAQNAAEVYKACRGDAEAAAAYLGGVWDQDGWSVYYGADLRPVSTPETAFYVVDVLPQTVETAGMGSAKAAAFLAEQKELLFEVQIAWQEEALHG